MTSRTSLLDLAGEDFVSLTTFRTTGVGVSTPVWIARDGDDLIVTTPDGTGKVKRVKNNGRATLAPSTRMGKVADGAVPVEGRVTVVPETPALTAIFANKYKFQYRLFMWIERRGKAGKKPRVVLRISPLPSS
ncbi:MAG: Pyridoxamine 5-phosphate oxidase [Microbacteriaceae bacterium]|nr:Pyridoxamine 5-phosphate oxidase [Microbacteriaceae bacterium]